MRSTGLRFMTTWGKTSSDHPSPRRSSTMTSSVSSEGESRALARGFALGGRVVAARSAGARAGAGDRRTERRRRRRSPTLPSPWRSRCGAWTPSRGSCARATGTGSTRTRLKPRMIRPLVCVPRGLRRKRTRRRRIGATSRRKLYADDDYTPAAPPPWRARLPARATPSLPPTPNPLTTGDASNKARRECVPLRTPPPKAQHPGPAPPARPRARLFTYA